MFENINSIKKCDKDDEEEEEEAFFFGVSNERVSEWEQISSFLISKSHLFIVMTTGDVPR